MKYIKIFEEFSQNLAVSSQVKAQLAYLKKNKYLTSEKFTILDDKNSKVHAFNPGYKLHKTYNVITGKNRGDQLKTKTVTNWIGSNWKGVASKFIKTLSPKEVIDYVDKSYFKQKEWEVKNTPSGVFRRAGITSNFLNNLVLTTFVESKYGKRYITFETCDGETIPFGFHGTKLGARVNVLKNIENLNTSKRKMSFGCINFKEADIIEINNFIDKGQVTIWLPDTTNNIVNVSDKCLKKGFFSSLIA